MCVHVCVCVCAPVVTLSPLSPPPSPTMCPLSVCRIVRVIRQPRGNMLLIGIGGSGRQSLARLAAYIIGFQVFQVEVTRHYRLQEFREGESGRSQLPVHTVHVACVHMHILHSRDSQLPVSAPDVWQSEVKLMLCLLLSPSRLAQALLQGRCREQADSLPLHGHTGGGGVLPGGHQQHPQQRGGPQPVQQGRGL